MTSSRILMSRCAFACTDLTGPRNTPITPPHTHTLNNRLHTHQPHRLSSVLPLSACMCAWDQRFWWLWVRDLQEKHDELAPTALPSGLTSFTINTEHLTVWCVLQTSSSISLNSISLHACNPTQSYQLQAKKAQSWIHQSRMCSWVCVCVCDSIRLPTRYTNMCAKHCARLKLTILWLIFWIVFLQFLLHLQSHVWVKHWILHCNRWGISADKAKSGTVCLSEQWRMLWKLLMQFCLMPLLKGQFT